MQVTQSGLSITYHGIAGFWMLWYLDYADVNNWLLIEITLGILLVLCPAISFMTSIPYFQSANVPTMEGPPVVCKEQQT